MSIEIWLAALTAGLALISYIWRQLVSRVETLEEKQGKLVSREEVKDLLNAKLDPMREDISEIRDLLARLIEVRFKKD